MFESSSRSTANTARVAAVMFDSTGEGGRQNGLGFGRIACETCSGVVPSISTDEWGLGNGSKVLIGNECLWGNVDTPLFVREI